MPDSARIGVVAPLFANGTVRHQCEGVWYLSLRSGVLDKTSSNICDMLFSNIPIEGWIIDPYEHGLLDSPGKFM